jgi:hypothetical protein
VTNLPKEGYQVVTITEQTHQKAHSAYVHKLKAGQLAGRKSFSRYIDGIIMEKIEADEYLSRMAPFMQKVGLQDNSIMIKDYKLNRIAEVQIQGRELLCLLCNKSNCVHVGYSYAIPEVYHVMSIQKHTRMK